MSKISYVWQESQLPHECTLLLHQRQARILQASTHIYVHLCNRQTAIMHFRTLSAHPLLTDLRVEFEQVRLPLDVEAVCAPYMAWKVCSVYDPHDVLEPIWFPVESICHCMTTVVLHNYLWRVWPVDKHCLKQHARRLSIRHCNKTNAITAVQTVDQKQSCSQPPVTAFVFAASGAYPLAVIVSSIPAASRCRLRHQQKGKTRGATYVQPKYGCKAIVKWL